MERALERDEGFSIGNRAVGAIVGATLGAWVGLEASDRKVLPTVLMTALFGIIGGSINEISEGLKKNPLPLPGDDVY